MNWYHLLDNCLLSRYWGRWDAHVAWYRAASRSVLQQERGGEATGKIRQTSACDNSKQKAKKMNGERGFGQGY